ncbi:MAG: hypothetical protein A3C30_02145 [Candidatus Levybacteria bacterium RIFCSPHIGHO2_02_FULL_40_18]|nr:MAG: hypothetical protein A2869_04525 [Candidatus Levybacteria bacterium RIFCSPHIGHO2_01_FULL_40_58]OGH26790.1 MAG: hypothetical protein A3C30_02145 [Candidatus Levybacteria bacterium RIFCSPHIGHO2_02_FULL_40_18]OGH31725.1 MAG: hypothetical protein A3E43_01865 [Candidatus Levybacteria bacterium RIFCSPHIGHO2_12_FULL_40_31]OGH40625.1 MAG: hypothetical protein A2894_00415 [Candidatus Levybacteria bacterium RIFCSPLOWO2_01_FULL_40_64]OGH48797.1 MAG: hypothetical protein A3I54_04040 [Candidatus Lev
MTGYVLIGDLESKNNFVANFIKKEDISSYNLFDYKEILKIPEVREIKKLLSKKAFSGKRRLFIIRDATIAAQNALLKTLEELPEDTYFIFLEETILIPTILSRVRLLKFERKKPRIDRDLETILGNFISGKKDLSSALLLADRLFSQNPNLTLNDLTLCLREILFKQIKQGDLEKTNFVLRFLKSLYQYIPLTDSNNLNKRLALERILLEIAS